MAKRKFKVPRGTGVKVAKELNLAPSHITRVIRGKREGGPTLVQRLEREESNHERNVFLNSIRKAQ